MIDKTALIVGASRGIGLGLAEELHRRGWTVTATARSSAPALDALAGPAFHVEHVDIDDDAAVTVLHGRLSQNRYGLIFVVAGVSNGAHAVLHDVPRPDAGQMFQTNSISPIRFAEAFCGLVQRGGTLALMTSRLGSVALNTRGGWEVYRASKAALNTLARSFALRHAEAGFDTLLMHPGWVRTDMGGPSADIDVATSATGMADVIERGGREGCTYLDYNGDTLPW